MAKKTIYVNVTYEITNDEQYFMTFINLHDKEDVLHLLPKDIVHAEKVWGHVFKQSLKGYMDYVKVNSKD